MQLCRCDEVAPLQVRGLQPRHYNEKFGCSRCSCLIGNSITHAWQLTLLTIVMHVATPILNKSIAGCFLSTAKYLSNLMAAWPRIRRGAYCIILQTTCYRM